MRGPDHDHDGHPDRVRTDRVHGTSTTDRVVTQPGVDPSVAKDIRRDAYERGRADERSRHKRNPLLTLLIAVAAVFGLAVIGLYIYNGGSFTETGRDLDAVTERAQDEAAQVGAEVADEAGEAMQDTGRVVEQRGEQARQPAESERR